MARSTKQKWLDREIARVERVLEGRKRKAAAVDDEVERLRLRRRSAVASAEQKLAELRERLEALS